MCFMSIIKFAMDKIGLDLFFKFTQMINHLSPSFHVNIVEKKLNFEDIEILFL